jgi:hypothetical protein
MARRKRHDKNQRDQDDEYDPQPRRPYNHRRGPSAKTRPFTQFRPPSPSDDSNSNFGTENPLQPRRQTQDHPQQSHWEHQDNLKARSSASTPLDHFSFLKKSRQLKRNLIRALTQVLLQVEQWPTEESLGDDLMDWQPEQEVVIPQADCKIYTYEPGGMRNGNSGHDKDGVREVRFGICSSEKQRAGSGA